MKHTPDTDHEIDSFEAPASSRGFIQILWQRKAFVILGAFVGLALGFLYHTQKPTVYSSSAQLLVIKRQAPDISTNRVNSGKEAVAEDYMSTHQVLMRSPVILDAASKKPEITNLKTFENIGDRASFMDYAVNVARDSAKETSGERNNILTLSFRGSVAEECPKILNAVIDSYQKFLDDNYRSISDKTMHLILDARDKLKKELAEAQAKYTKFRIENGQIHIKEGVNPVVERIATFESERSQLILKQTKLREQIRGLGKAIEDGTGKDAAENLEEARKGGKSGLSPELIKHLEDPLLNLRLELQSLAEEFGADHPKVKSLKSRIKLVQKHLEATAPKAADEKDPAKLLLKKLEAELEDNKMSVDALDENLKAMKDEARKSNAYELTENELRRNVADTRALYEETIKRVREIDILRDAGGFDARVLRPASNGAVVSPILRQDLLLGLMLGLLIGTGLAYLADIADKSFRSPEEIRKQMGLPLVGHIPFFLPDPDTAKRRAAGEATVDPMLCCYFKPKSLDSEAYRAVRTTLFFNTQSQGLKVIQVTSPNKGDGKSLLISNLAVTTAQSGKRVLLIDADCRRPRQHKVFNVSNTIGLATILNGEATPEQGVHETCIPNLSVMGSGPIPPNPSELLVSPRFKELLDGFRNEFDYVFVDTPPLLAVTDPCIVADKVDGLFLAIRLTRKGRPDAERAREILQSLKVRTFGIVVNGVTRTNAGLYSSQAYDYSDKYMDYEEDDKSYYYADEDDLEVGPEGATVAPKG